MGVAHTLMHSSRTHGAAGGGKVHTDTLLGLHSHLLLVEVSLLLVVVETLCLADHAAATWSLQAGQYSMGTLYSLDVKALRATPLVQLIASGITSNFHFSISWYTDWHLHIPYVLIGKCIGCVEPVIVICGLHNRWMAIIIVLGWSLSPHSIPFMTGHPINHLLLVRRRAQTLRTQSTITLIDLCIPSLVVILL